MPCFLVESGKNFPILFFVLAYVKHPKTMALPHELNLKIQKILTLVHLSSIQLQNSKKIMH